MAAHRRTKKTKTKWVPVVNGTVPKSVKEVPTSSLSSKEQDAQKMKEKSATIEEIVATKTRKPSFLWEALLHEPQDKLFDAGFKARNGKPPTMKMNLDFVYCILNQAYMCNSAESLDNEKALLRCWELHQNVMWLREQRSQKNEQEDTGVEEETVDSTLQSESVHLILQVAQTQLINTMECVHSFLQTNVSVEEEGHDTSKKKKKRSKNKSKNAKNEEEPNQIHANGNQIEGTNVENQVSLEASVVSTEKKLLNTHNDSEKIPISGVERFFIAEIINITTEIVKCRVPWRDRELLVKWQTTIDSTKQKLHECEYLWNHAKYKKATKSPFRATISVCNNRQRDLQEFAEFLHTSEEKERNGFRPLLALKVPSELHESVYSINEEIWNLFSSLHINEQDEQCRLDIAHRIQQLLHQRKFKLCLSHTLRVYGSSKSGFGAKSADIDLCFCENQVPSLTHPQDMSLRFASMQLQNAANVQNEEAGALSFVYLLNMQQQVWDKLEKLKVKPGKDNATESGELENVDQNRIDGKSKNTIKGEKEEVKECIIAHLRHFYSILQQMCRNCGQSEASSNSMKTSSTEPSPNVPIDKANLFKVRDILVGCGYDIRAIIHHARIPIIRFLDRASQIECDLSFGNIFASSNTLLLRSYAHLDKRLRIIGFAVKHWAKCRGLVDAACGYLSSYSFIVMTIYYYLVRTHLIANLQDHQLIQECHPEHTDNLPMFCTQLEHARQYHTAHLAAKGERMLEQVDLRALLVGFFDFYANIFNFASHVICIRLARSILPIEYIDKIDRWGTKAKIWRISIEDPLEVDRDLGCVLRPHNQNRIIQEFTRAYKLLTSGQSFVGSVCTPKCKK